MSKIVRITLATAFALTAGLYATASFATNSREAIDACSKNPKCAMDVGNDGVVISVGGKLIVCPIKNGPCGVASRIAPIHNFGALNTMTEAAN